MHFTITGVKKIVRNTEDFVFRGSLYRSSTVILVNEQRKKKTKIWKKFNNKVYGFACHL